MRPTHQSLRGETWERRGPPALVLALQALGENAFQLWSRFLAWVYRPCNAFWPCMAFGAFLWALPLQEGCGITKREGLTLIGSALLIAWYGGISLFAWFGERLAKATPLLRMPRIDEVTFYFAATGFSIVGVAASWHTVIKAGVPLSEIIASHNGNTLKHALYENYSFLHTLRYGAGLSGGIAMFRVLFRDRRSVVDVLNTLLLLAAAVISSRLLLVQAVFICFGTALRFGGLRRFGLVKMLVFGGLVLAALVAMTWFREADYYAKFKNGNNPLVAQSIHVRRYLGTPFQGAVGTARIALEEQDRPAHVLKPWKNALPTFFLPEEDKKDEALGRNQWSLDRIDIDEELTTNSALTQLYGDMGIACFPFMGLAAFLFSWLAGVTWKQRNPLCFVSLILLYGFFELWRMFIFNQGCMVFMEAEIVACCSLAAVLPWCRNDSQRFLLDRR